MKNLIYFFLTLPLLTFACTPQITDETFIPEKNTIDTLMHSEALKTVFKNLTLLKSGKSRQFTIMHIGDSHLEIGQFSGEIKKQFTEEYGKGEIGWEFPYQLFNPQSMKVFPLEAKGKWKRASIKQEKISTPLGVTGLAFYLEDSLGELHFNKRIKDESFTKIEFLHYTEDDSFPIVCENAKISTKKVGKHTAITTLLFEKPEDNALVKFNEIVKPIIYALRINAFENAKGITYHKFGVAGSTLDQFINNTPLFQEQLAVIEPNLIIISLGTNDSYIDTLNVPRISSQLNSFVKEIQQTSPKTTILFTTAPDTKYKNSRPQRITEINTIIRNQIKNDKSLVLWDLNTIMGGDNSMEEWCKRFYVNSDSLHFNFRGYKLQGELFMEALKRANKY
jgi:lysophospholipase L1-like esterase